MEWMFMMVIWEDHARIPATITRKKDGHCLQGPQVRNPANQDRREQAPSAGPQLGREGRGLAASGHTCSTLQAHLV